MERTGYIFIVEELNMQLRVMLRLAIRQPFCLVVELPLGHNQILLFMSIR